jgi:outer membrane receptor protein involved in Fe transport
MVTVTAGAAVLRTEDATISEAINERTVAELPISGGRNVWSLAGTTPGVLEGTNQFVGAGQRNYQNSLSLDGINTASNINTQTSMRPIADAVTEIEVQTGSTSAEYGSYLGVHINVVTKSGTNQFHGTAYEFYRSDALAARGYFEDRSSPPNPLRIDQFGFQMDGPLVIPKLFDGRNKTFFVAAYEGVRSESTGTSIVSVPTERMRQGDFSEFGGTIRNPFTRSPYPNNIIPQSELSPIAGRLLAYYPLPNRPGTGSNLLANGSSTSETNQILTRVDQNIGNKVRLYVRYNLQDQEGTNIGAIPTSGTTQPLLNHNTLVAYTHTLRSNLLNDFRIGYHRVNNDNFNYFFMNDLRTAGTDLGIPGFDGDVRYNNPGIPTFNITGFTALASGGNITQFDTTFQFSNVVAYTRGSHNIRTGFDARRLEAGRRQANVPRGSFTFNSQMTGYAMADFMLGLPRQVTTPVDQIQSHVRGWRTGYFANDTWQATPNLTLNLGLRYELNTPVQSLDGYISMLDADQTTLIPKSHPAPGFKMHEPNLKDFGPRVGFAYRANDKTVLRAGFGIYYNPVHLTTFTFLTNNPPLAAEFLFVSDPSSPTLSLESPFGVVGPGGPPNITSPNRHLPNARKNQWSFDIQRELWTGTMLDLQYVGSRTRNLDRSFFNNTPQPGPGPVDPRRPRQDFRVIRIVEGDLVNNYDAISVILRRRMSRGLQTNAHYTWSRTRDMGDNLSLGQASISNPYDIWADYGPADWDVPHRFVATYIYDVPFFKDSRHAIVRHMLSGWQVAGVSTFESGRPFNVTIQADRANVGRGGQRPDVVGTPTADCGGHQLVGCIDASAFGLPAMYTYGNAPRNLLRGPGDILTDLSVIKNVRIGGRAQFQLRGEVFNVFNRANFNNPNSVFGTANFGRITSAGSMRQVQLGGKLLF